MDSKVKLKYCLELRKGKLPKELTDKKEKNFPVYLSMDYLRGNTNSVKYVSDVNNGVLADEGDILILWDGSNAGEILKSKEGVISSTTALIETNEGVDKQFLFFLLKSNETFIKDLSVGMGIPHVNPQELLNSSFSIPSLNEQTQIANYLDQKTAKIDQLIANKEELLQLYDEEKTAVINRAVTKGINPDVNFKDSGIEWLGDIPECWEVVKLKYVAHLKSGNNIVSSQIKKSGDFPVFGGNGLRGYYKDFTHNGNFILIGRQGAYCGNINYSHNKFWASEHAVVVSPLQEYDVLFLGELLKMMDLNQYSVSAAQPGLSVEKIKNLMIPFPSYKGQKSISAYLEKETAKIDTKINNTKKLIDLLKEYREALISEVVTGKVNVTD